MIENAIRRQIAVRQEYYTPDKHRPFWVDEKNDDFLNLLFGKKRTRTKIAWTVLEGIHTFLKGKGWVEIGTVYSIDSKPDTLDWYLKQHIYRATAGWLASILEASGIVEIDRNKPQRVRLIE